MITIKNYKVIVTLLVILSIYSNSSAQQIDERKMVGFACFYAGRETKLVSRFGKLLQQNKYSRIRVMINNESTDKKLMAVICLERLQTAGKLKLTPEEKLLIQEIKSSTEPVAVCSGCVPHPGMPLKEFFNSGILVGATIWLDEYIK